MIRRFHKALLAGLAFGAVLQPAMAITGKELEAKIVEAKILKANQSVSASISGDEAVVQKSGVNVREDYKKDDFKLDAVFIGKEVMSADPSINKVRVVFLDANERGLFCQVTVHIPIIKTFANGGMSQSDLLKSFSVEGPFTTAQASSTPRSTPKEETKSSVATVGSATSSSTGTGTGTDTTSDTKSIEKGEVKDAGKDEQLKTKLVEQLNQAKVSVKHLEATGNMSSFNLSLATIEDEIKNQKYVAAQDNLTSLFVNINAQAQAMKKAKGITGGAAGSSPGLAKGTSVHALVMANRAKTRETFWASVADHNGDFELALREKYGVFQPVRSAILYPQRYYIAECILALRQAGIDVRKYQEQFTLLNKASMTHQTQLAFKIKDAFFLAFHVDEKTCMEWWSTVKTHYQ